MEDFKPENYDQTIKDLRTARNKFRSIAEDPNTPHAKKFLYDHLKDHLEYRIDFLNVQNGKEIETPKGKDIVINSKEGLYGLWLKSLRLFKNYFPTILVTSLTGIVTWVVTTFISVGHGVTKAVVNTVKYVAPIVAKASPYVAGGMILLSNKLIDSIKWFSNHIYEIIIGGITVTFSLYSMYGDEYSYPILAFWLILTIYLMLILDKVLSYTDKVKEYFTPTTALSIVQ